MRRCIGTSVGIVVLTTVAYLSVCIASESAASPPQHRENPKDGLPRWKDGFRFRERRHALRRLEGGDPKLHVNATIIEGGLDGIVNVSWTGIEFTSSSDWIGMWPAGTDLSIFSAPIKFKYVMGDPTLCPSFQTEEACDAQAPICTWYAPKSKCESGKPPSNGSVPFRVENVRTAVFFVYVSGNIQYPEPICQTSQVSFEKPEFPQGAHLAFGEGGDPTSMRVYWTSGDADGEPVVRYGPRVGDYRFKVAASADPGRQYTKKDLCDVEVQPAGRQGWLSSTPTLLSATMTDLVPGSEIHYVFGDAKANLWSTDRTFVVPPKSGDPDRRTVVAAFGDMGNVELDGAGHHSWDFNNRGEVPSLNTTRALESDAGAEFVLHIGDISYAVGYMSEWDHFFRQIEPVASGRAWMPAIGNHEQGYSKSYPFPGTDSGGECGVLYNAHFPFASQDPTSSTPFDQREPWYAFTYGNVAFVQMSTEHDFAPSSVQHAWIRRALAGVDRNVHPWIVFSGHRPMYIGSDWPGDAETGDMIRASIEPLLVEFSVDVAIWGHFHAYERFCDGALNGTSCGKGPTQHYVIGMGGYDHSKCPTQTAVPTMQRCNDTHWGYMRMTFENRTDAIFEFVAGDSGAVLDVSHVRRSREQ
eukprot:g972.t1